MEKQTIQSKAAGFLRQLLRKPAPVSTPAPAPADLVKPVEPATSTDPATPAV